MPTKQEKAKCDHPFVPSCETQERLAECLKTAICDFLWCFEGELCADGTPNLQKVGPALQTCLGSFLCSVARCIPEALCPPPPGECIEPLCLSANFAIEESQG